VITTTTPHIFLDEQGRGWIDDTNTKVIEVALDRLSGLSPEQIQQGYPYLSLTQIHAALSFYQEHKAEYDLEIARQEREYERLRKESLDSPVRQKLNANGRIA
jgi:uncharacterized protein (DUF433 family)